MVKTTFVLKDEVYKKLVKEAVEKYGKSRALSKVANEILEASFSKESSAKNESEEIERRLNIVRRSAGIWKSSESGKEYTKKIRADWDKRLRKMGL